MLPAWRALAPKYALAGSGSVEWGNARIGVVDRSFPINQHHLSLNAHLGGTVPDSDGTRALVIAPIITISECLNLELTVLEWK